MMETKPTGMVMLMLPEGRLMDGMNKFTDAPDNW
jgi:hypothetical protein